MGGWASEGLTATDTSISDLVIIDVREKSEWDSGHVPEAIHIPVGSIETKIPEIVPNKNAKIRVYCAAGRRAGQAKRALIGMGYTDVRNLGGFEDATFTLERIRT
jgi:rhodanese-related sulfurtransferase